MLRHADSSILFVLNVICRSLGFHNLKVSLAKFHLHIGLNALVICHFSTLQQTSRYPRLSQKARLIALEPRQERKLQELVQSL